MYGTLCQSFNQISKVMDQYLPTEMENSCVISQQPTI